MSRQEIVDMDHRDTEPLARLLALSRDHLASCPEARRLLTDNGLTDESVWSRYRLGASGKEVTSLLNKPDREALLKLEYMRSIGVSAIGLPGIIIPTFDPSKPDDPVGLVKISPAQNKHAFVKHKKGLACPSDIDQHDQIVITDNPFLCLKLAQLGCKVAVLAEDPEVLPPYIGWLKDKTITLASYRKGNLNKLRKALGPIEDNAHGIFIPSMAWNLPQADLDRLGIEKMEDKPKVVRKPITAELVRDLAIYAQGRLADGHGSKMLKALEVEDPELIRSLNLGYFPSNFLYALDEDATQSLGDRNLSSALILPAMDENGIAVDLLAIKGPEGTRTHTRLFQHPKGLLCSKIITVFPKIVSTDSFKILAKLWSHGVQNVILFRGEEDALNNIERLKKAGVHSLRFACWSKTLAESLAKKFKDQGFASSVIKMPQAIKDMDGEWVRKNALLEDNSDSSQYPTPSLVANDPAMEQATFKTADLVYQVQTSVDTSSRLEVIVTREERMHRDRFDLASERARKRFSESAGAKLKVPHGVIEKHLDSLLDAVREIQKASMDLEHSPIPAVAIPEEERKEALKYLSNPELIEAIAKDLEALGWIGEQQSKRLLYMVGISRKLDNPLSAAVRSQSGSGKSIGLDVLSELVPPEDLIHVSHLSDSALYRSSDLRHKLLTIDEADSLSKEAIVALRILQSRGSLSHGHVETDGVTRRAVTRYSEAKGPVAVLTSTTKELDSELIGRCFDLSADDSSQQTAKILEAQRKLKADPKAIAERARIVKLHRNVQRLIANMPVLIPFADRIQFPSHSIKYRREQERFLNLISASALLHQHQRLKDCQYILATEKDFEIAKELAAGLVAVAGDELSKNARDLLGMLKEWKLRSFSLGDLVKRNQDWYRRRYLRTLEELTKLHFISSHRKGRGAVSRFELLGDADADRKVSSIELLLPKVKLDKLDKVGQTDLSNFTSESATG